MCDRLLAEQVRTVSEDLKTRYTTCPVFTKQACGLLIYEAETRKRHANYPTTDLPLSQFELGYSMVMSRIYALVIPQIAAMFHFEKEAIDVEDLFLIRYTEGKQHGLNETQGRLLVLLRGPFKRRDFAGGGTRLNGRVHTPPIGEALIFCGQQDHSGVPISRGTRYVLARVLVFLRINTRPYQVLIKQLGFELKIIDTNVCALVLFLLCAILLARGMLVE